MKEQSLEEKKAELEALLNAYSRSHSAPVHPELAKPVIPPEPKPEAPAEEIGTEPEEPVPDEEVCAEPEEPVLDEEVCAEPEEPAPDEEVCAEPEEPAPDEEICAEPEKPALDEEMPIEAGELTDFLTEAVEEEKEAELAGILAELEEAKDEETDFSEEEPPDDEEDMLSEEEAEAEEELSEEEEEAEEERRISRFTRGCLEVAIFFAALAVLLLLLEQIGICIGYELPQLFLPLTMVAGSLLALTVCLYSALRKTLASFVMLVSIWFLIMLYAITNFQFPEVIPTKLPETDKAVTLTQITTPINANLCVDEILIPGCVSRRFKLPVHPKYMPLRYQVQLIYNEESYCNELYYNDLLWAVYDPARRRWKNATSIGSMMPETTEPPPETAPMTRKPRRTGRSGKSTTTTTTTTTVKNND